MAVLSLAQRPMSGEEIARAVGGELSLRSLRQRLMDDPRVQRVGKNHFGLPEWGYDEYTTVSDEIAEEIERQGGAASLEHLVEVISATYGVAPSSIRVFAMSRRFARNSDGSVRLAGPEEAAADVRPLALTRGCYRLDGNWSVRVTITSETLRGSGTPVPECFAAHLGLKPGEHMKLKSPFGVIGLSWGYTNAYLGSLRAVANALKATTGDLLFVRAADADRLEFELVSHSSLERLDAMERTSALVAWGGLGPGSRPLDAVSHALGIDGETDADAVEARLRARRELELLPVAAECSNTRSADLALADLLDLLAEGGPAL